jgi:hypothetical protein
MTYRSTHSLKITRLHWAARSSLSSATLGSLRATDGGALNISGLSQADPKKVRLTLSSQATKRYVQLRLTHSK